MGADWTLSTAIELANGLDIPATIARYKQGLMPLSESEGFDGKGELSLQIDDSLAMIATKLNPTMSAEQAGAWIKTVRVSLSDISGRVLRDATRQALSFPIRFFPEVDGAIRGLALAIDERHALALWRLKRLQDEITKGEEPRLSPPAGYKNGDPPMMTQGQAVQMLAGFNGAGLLKIGLACGAISQAVFDQAMLMYEAKS